MRAGFRLVFRALGFHLGFQFASTEHDGVKQSAACDAQLSD